MNALKKEYLPLMRDGMNLARAKACEVFGFGDLLMPYPYVLHIEPTNACNLHCPTCPTGSGKMNRPGRMMSFPEFKGIIDQVRGYARTISLWNFGEPFLNKELLSMIGYATSAGIFVVTSTNGHFLGSEEFCSDIVRSGLQHLIICLDGADQETMNRLRKNARFDDIMGGFTLMTGAKRKLNSQTPKIELQFIVTRHNEHQREYMRHLAKRLNVDTYCEKPVGIDYSFPDFQELAKDLLPSDLSLSRFYQKQDGTFELKGRIPNRCLKIYQSTVINSDGSVVPCSYDVFSDYVMGNIFEDSLKTIWKNDKYQDFRRQIRQDRKSISICNACPEGRFAIKTEIA